MSAVGEIMFKRTCGISVALHKLERRGCDLIVRYGIPAVDASERVVRVTLRNGTDGAMAHAASAAGRIAADVAYRVTGRLEGDIEDVFRRAGIKRFRKVRT